MLDPEKCSYLKGTDYIFGHNMRRIGELFIGKSQTTYPTKNPEAKMNHEVVVPKYVVIYSILSRVAEESLQHL